MQVKPDGAYRMFMEVLGSKILPLELHAVATQFWRLMAQPHLKLTTRWLAARRTHSRRKWHSLCSTTITKSSKTPGSWSSALLKKTDVYLYGRETKVEGTLSAAQSMRHRDSGWTLVVRQCADSDTAGKSHRVDYYPVVCDCILQLLCSCICTASFSVKTPVFTAGSTQSEFMTSARPKRCGTSIAEV